MESKAHTFLKKENLKYAVFKNIAIFHTKQSKIPATKRYIYSYIDRYMYISYPYIWEIWVGVIVSVPHALSYEIFLSEGCKFSQLNLWEISQNHEIHIHSKQRKNNQCYPLPQKMISWCFSDLNIEPNR